MQRLLLALWIVLALPVAALARRGDSAAVGPYEDLLEVLSMHAWHLGDDPYRQPVATDADGRNVFLSTLDRLDGWKTRFPSRLPDVVEFARAQAFERVGAWEDAAVAFGHVAVMADSSLAPAASSQLAVAQRFRDTDAIPEDGRTLQELLDALAGKLDAWREVATGPFDEPHRRLALVEVERLETRTALLLTRHRHALVDGDATAERALRALIERHPDSKLLPRHVLRLADFYADVAEDYADRRDRPLDFEASTFDLLVDRALDAYQKLASWDGIPEKPTAAARFDAVQSFRDATHEGRE